MGRVLVVDDDRMLQEFLHEELLRLGHEAVLALSGGEALESVRAAPPDLILLDLRMPMMDGIDALRALRAAGNRAPVILLTARRNPATIGQAQALGAVDILFKPVDLTHLTALVEEMLASGRER